VRIKFLSIFSLNILFAQGSTVASINF